MAGDGIIAYFSMEIALHPAIPSYSGGLGILAGDTVRAAADLKLPFVGVTLLYRKGFFRQELDREGRQIEFPVDWRPEDYLKPCEVRVEITLDARKVVISAWRYEVEGADGNRIPVILLDASNPENSDYDRQLTDNLYSGDQYHRLCQEAVLGIGGVRILKELGYRVFRYHMNEGHASLLGLELLSQQMASSSRTVPDNEDIHRVRTRCVFTTHTPIPAGHDRFPVSLARQVLEHKNLLEFENVCSSKDELNMTRLGINLSHFVNGVSKKHKEVSQKMFPDCSVQGITNGVHATSWIAPPFKELYNRYASGWQLENSLFRHALNIPDEELWAAHMKCKELLFDYVQQKTGIVLKTDIFTCGFARRSTAYKRPVLVFSDREKLRSLSKKAGGIQLIFAGKAHPADGEGKSLIQSVIKEAEYLNPEVKVVFISDYDFGMAHLLLSGCDLWLNTPTPPLEASGTSGMKAALNGVPSLSVLDGWWLEGCIEGVTGWAIEDQKEENNSWSERDTANSLYEALDQKIIPLFNNGRDKFINIMRHAIAINGSYFNTERMLREYIVAAYFSPSLQE